MLALFRHFANTILGKILVAFLMAGMSIWGISNVITSLGSTTVATVAGQDISVRDFQRAYQNALNAAARSSGRTPTPQEALAMGIPGQVIGSMAADLAVGKFSADLGLGVSDDHLKKLVVTNKAFADTLGNYSADIARQVISQNGYTEAEFNQLQRRNAVREQLDRALFSGFPVPQTAYDIINRYSADQRSVDYVTLNKDSVSGLAEPTDADLAAYLKDHQSDFRTKETRSVDIFVLSPDVLAAGITVSDADIAAEYEKSKAKYVTPERRAVKQIALTTPELEKAFTDGLAAGKPIGELLVETKATFTDLGTVAKSELVDQSLADAAFGLAKKDDYTIIDGIGGKRVITVSDIVAGGQKTLDDVKGDIAKQLALAEARNTYGDALDQAEELRAARKPLTEVAARFNAKPYSLALTPGAPELVGIEAIAADQRGKVADAIFNADAGDFGAAISLGSNRNVWFDLSKIEPARDQTLDEARDAVKAAWVTEETNKAIQAEVDKIIAELKTGKSFADAVGVVGELPQTTVPMSRQGDKASFTGPIVAEIFNGGPDHYGSAQNNAGDTIVFKVAEVTPATGDASDYLKSFLKQSMDNSLQADFSTGIRVATGVSFNDKVLNQVLAVGAQ